MSWMITLSDFRFWRHKQIFKQIFALCLLTKRVAHRRKLLEHPNLRLKSIRCRTGLELLHQLLRGALSQEDLTEVRTAIQNTLSGRERNGRDIVVNCEMQYEQLAFLKNNHIHDRCKWENVLLCYTLFRIKLKFKSWFSWLGLDFWWLDVRCFLLLLVNSFLETCHFLLATVI